MRFRPRFSVRKLVIFVTLVCVYFGTWEATKRYGVPDCSDSFLRYQQDAVHAAATPIPLIVTQDHCYLDDNNGDPTFRNPRRYYVWIFGPKLKLPYESSWDPYRDENG